MRHKFSTSRARGFNKTLIDIVSLPLLLSMLSSRWTAVADMLEAGPGSQECWRKEYEENKLHQRPLWSPFFPERWLPARSKNVFNSQRELNISSQVACCQFYLYSPDAENVDWCTWGSSLRSFRHFSPACRGSASLNFLWNSNQTPLVIPKGCMGIWSGALTLPIYTSFDCLQHRHSSRVHQKPYTWMYKSQACDHHREFYCLSSI